MSYTDPIITDCFAGTMLLQEWLDNVPNPWQWVVHPTYNQRKPYLLNLNDAVEITTFSSSDREIASVGINGELYINGAGTGYIRGWAGCIPGNIYQESPCPLCPPEPKPCRATGQFLEKTIIVNKRNQSIIFPPIPSKKYKDPPFKINVRSTAFEDINNWTYTSKKPVIQPYEFIYSSSNEKVATIDNMGTVNINGFGTTIITVNQDGEKGIGYLNCYNPAPSASQELKIFGKKQTINFPSIPFKSLDDLPFKLVANTDSNLPIYFSSSNPSILSIDQDLAKIINIGDVIITAYQDGDENWEPAEAKITIQIKKKSNINFSNIPIKFLGDLPFNINATSENNEINILYKSSNTNIATISSDGIVNILNYGKVDITAYQLETNSFFGKTLTKELIINKDSSSFSSSIIDYIKSSAYINYNASKYSNIIPNEIYYSYLPKPFQTHTLLLDLNLYGFDEDTIEDCDIEMNAIILKTGFFHNIVKNPSLLNLEIKDLMPSTGIIYDVDDYFKEKNLIKNIKVNNIFQYNTSYFNEKTIYSDKKFKLIKTYISIDRPIASYTKNIPLPIIFEYKNPTNNLSYNLGEYTLAILDEKNEQIQSGNFITGLETGFLTFLNPGKYTLILSGDEKDFLINENSSNKKNENLSAVSLNIKTVPEEKITEIYQENYDEIWASYYLDYREIVSGSGSYTLNNQLPQAFNIDFQRNISGNIESPTLFYKEYTGYFENNCSSSQIITEVDPICTKSLMVICAIAASYEASGKNSMEVPRKNLPKSKYSAITSTVTIGTSSFAIAKLESEELTLERPWITYLEDPQDLNYYTIAIDNNLKETCCYCKSEQAECPECIKDPFLDVQNQIYSGIQFADSGDAIYNSVYFLDDINPKALSLLYNNSYYSGQIVYKEFEEGDKLVFNQYQYDFNNVFKQIYDLNHIPVDKEPIKKEFIFSKTLIGDNYFSGKNDLINKINFELANKNYYTWIPFKYNPNIEFNYGPLLSGKNGGINSNQEEVIDIIALNSGKLGAYSLKLELKPRNKIYNYMVPKVIKLQISEDGENWIDVVSSENVQPINTYLKSSNDIVSDINYNNIPNTTYTIEKSITVSSETSSQNKGSDVEDLAELATGLWNVSPLNTGNKNTSSSSSSNSVICIPSVTGSGKYCGSGYVDFTIENISKNKGFKCSVGEEKIDCGTWQPSGDHLVTECDPDLITNSKYQGYSGDCCTGKYHPIDRPFGWCCSGVYVEGINEIGCKPCEDKEKSPVQGETKSEETIKVKQDINTFRIGFYDYRS